MLWRVNGPIDVLDRALKTLNLERLSLAEACLLEPPHSLGESFKLWIRNRWRVEVHHRQW